MVTQESLTHGFLNAHHVRVYVTLVTCKRDQNHLFRFKWYLLGVKKTLATPSLVSVFYPQTIHTGVRSRACKSLF